MQPNAAHQHVAARVRAGVRHRVDCHVQEQVCLDRDAVVGKQGGEGDQQCRGDDANEADARAQHPADRSVEAVVAWACSGVSAPALAWQVIRKGGAAAAPSPLTQADVEDEGQAAEGERPGQRLCCHVQAAVLNGRRCKNGPDFVQQVEQEGHYCVAGQGQKNLRFPGYSKLGGFNRKGRSLGRHAPAYCSTRLPASGQRDRCPGAGCAPP